MAESLLMIEEVSERTRVPLSTLRYYRHRGEGPRSFKIGRRVMYRQEDVDAWIGEQMRRDDPKTPAA